MYLYKFVHKLSQKSFFFFKLGYINDNKFISEFTYFFINIAISIDNTVSLSDV